MARNTSKKPAATQIEDYEMHGEFSRPTLPTGEYSGIATEVTAETVWNGLRSGCFPG